MSKSYPADLERRDARETTGMTTVKTKFDPKDLPAWAKRFPQVVKMCRLDIGYRIEVHRATGWNSQQFLLTEANNCDDKDYVR